MSNRPVGFTDINTRTYVILGTEPNYLSISSYENPGKLLYSLIL